MHPLPMCIHPLCACIQCTHHEPCIVCGTGAAANAQLTGELAITHHSPHITHHSPLTARRSPLATHHSPLTPHHSPFPAQQIHVPGAADSERTGKLAISVWAAETQHVLGLRVALRRAFAHMPGVEDDSINYGAFLLRFALRCPDLTLFYPMRTFLLSLMATKDTTGAGEVTMPDFEACCQTLHMHEPDAAELCQPPSRLLAACGAVSAGWVQRGTVAVADFERCFDVTELC